LATNAQETISQGRTNMTPEEIAAELQQLRTSLEALRQNAGEPRRSELTKAEELEVSEKSFQVLLGTKGHLQNSGSHILTAIAFLTTAAATIYREARAIHQNNECLQQWATLWFTAYIVCVSMGALYLLGALWSPLWPARTTLKPSEKRPSLLDLTATGDLVPAKFDALIAAYKNDRESLRLEGLAVGRILKTGEAWILVGFLFLLALTSNLFAAENFGSGIPLIGILMLLGFTLMYGRYLRDEKRGWKTSKRWSLAWGALIIVSFVALIFVITNGRTVPAPISNWCPGWDRPHSPANAT
jgi:hypothetical protein